MAVRTTSEKVKGLAAASAEVTRLRLGLEGTWRGLEAGGGALIPRLEVGVRHDGGDAETGFGLDLGGGLSGSLAWDPGQGSGRGPTLSLTQTVGAAATGGVDALLGRRTLAGLAANDNGDGGDELENRRLELRLGYGFSAFEDRFTSTPEFGLGALAERARVPPRLAARARRARSSCGSRGRGARAPNDDTPEHGIGLRLSARW